MNKYINIYTLNNSKAIGIYTSSNSTVMANHKNSIIYSIYCNLFFRAAKMKITMFIIITHSRKYILQGRQIICSFVVNSSCVQRNMCFSIHAVPIRRCKWTTLPIRPFGMALKMPANSAEETNKQHP